MRLHDVEVELAPGAGATSVKGGWLLACSLAEKTGRVLGTAEGEITLSTGEGDWIGEASGRTRGRVPGGGRFKGGTLGEGREKPADRSEK